MLSGRDFLNRLKLKTDIDAMCKTRVQNVRTELEDSSGDIDALIASERDNFASKARAYFIYLLETLLRDVHLTADIVHGMACFDPHVLVSLPMDQVNFCFAALFQTFCLRGWVQRASESDYRDEYVEFVEYFRTSFPHLKDQPGQVKDIVGFLIALPSLRSRKNLLYLFRLTCLCLTESGADLPAIKFHEVDTSNSKCRLTDMLLPARSYLINCPGAVNFCTSETSLSKLRAMAVRWRPLGTCGRLWTSHILEEPDHHFQRTQV